MELAESEDPDFKHHVLPLARIKKVMKSDEDVQVSFPPFFFLLRLLTILPSKPIHLHPLNRCTSPVQPQMISAEGEFFVLKGKDGKEGRPRQRRTPEI